MFKNTKKPGADGSAPGSSNSMNTKGGQKSPPHSPKLAIKREKR
ncbi:hypothetical protein SAMD00020551_0661 [Mesobacillus selenatarsenatis SF-1]|uniref:Uncharacterized protein n=1 Tax=Mesobacillus selenatarsenatis (strain DSM 18680 / JCM 14380 / FERM P-15431 / SF-1) TaxID=1321606 RepID=A0A0A8X311_MESS1|nr:hypothetical protein SAMD00020551_0661 [Mesobacillus selenatarsenatis SF-1]